MFFKKKKIVSDVSIDLSLINYLPGQCFYVGGDDVLLILFALQMALQYCDVLRVLKPKEYQKIRPLVDYWSFLFEKNKDWYDMMVQANSLNEVI